jgi:hypothetical protein
MFRAVLLCAHALHGHAGRWLVNEKGAVAAAGRLDGAPDRFAERAQDVLARLGRQPRQLLAAIDAAADLLRDTTRACSSPVPAGASPRDGAPQPPGAEPPAYGRA